MRGGALVLACLFAWGGACTPTRHWDASHPVRLVFETDPGLRLNEGAPSELEVRSSGQPIRTWKGTQILLEGMQLDLTGADVAGRELRLEGTLYLCQNGAEKEGPKLCTRKSISQVLEQVDPVRVQLRTR